MLHNHFIVFDKDELRACRAGRPATIPTSPTAASTACSGPYARRLPRVLRQGARPADPAAGAARRPARLALTGYPQGLPSWEIQGGVAALKDSPLLAGVRRASSRASSISTAPSSARSRRATRRCCDDIYFPELVESVLLFNNDFLKTAKMVRDRCIVDADYANAIRWQPAFKQLIYRNDAGKLIVTISQNSIGNAITELLGRGGQARTGCRGLRTRRAGADRTVARGAPPPGRGGPRRRHRRRPTGPGHEGSGTAAVQGAGVVCKCPNTPTPCMRNSNRGSVRACEAGHTTPQSGWNEAVVHTRVAATRIRRSNDGLSGIRHTAADPRRRAGVHGRQDGAAGPRMHGRAVRPLHPDPAARPQLHHAGRSTASAPS